MDTLSSGLYLLLLQLNDEDGEDGGGCAGGCFVNNHNHQDLEIVGHMKMSRRDFVPQRFFHAGDFHPGVVDPAPVAKRVLFRYLWR